MSKIKITKKDFNRELRDNFEFGEFFGKYKLFLVDTMKKDEYYVLVFSGGIWIQNYHYNSLDDYPTIYEESIQFDELYQEWNKDYSHTNTFYGYIQRRILKALGLLDYALTDDDMFDTVISESDQIPLGPVIKFIDVIAGLVSDYY